MTLGITRTRAGPSGFDASSVLRRLRGRTVRSKLASCAYVQKKRMLTLFVFVRLEGEVLLASAYVQRQLLYH